MRKCRRINREDTIASHAYDSAGRLVAMERSGARYFYHLNARSDVLALTDESGEIVNSYRYDPYGRVLEANEAVSNPYRYASYRFDEGSGLYYLWNRYYDPTTMRFITKDIYPGEITSPGTMNGYAYCLGDPVNWTDPSGRFVLVDDAAVALVLIFVAVAATVSVMSTPANQQATADAWEEVTAGVQEAGVNPSRRLRERHKAA